jgi:hypothetical protein
MMKKTGTQRTTAKQLDAHHFEAIGTAPFIKFPRGAVAIWKASSPMVFAATEGMRRSGSSLFTLGKGKYIITPVGSCQVFERFTDSFYVLSYRRLADIMRTRYAFTVRLRPDWEENLWPYLFRFFMRYGDWPLRISDFERIFRSVLRRANASVFSTPDSLTRLQEIRHQVSAEAMIRIGRRRSARLLARENAGAIIRELVRPDFSRHALVEMEAFRALNVRDGIIPLVGEFYEDETRLKVPFEIARPARITIRGQCTVEYMWEYGDQFEDGDLCSLVELTPEFPMPLPDGLKVHAARTQIPLDFGEKTAYGTSFEAPLICKGEDAKMLLRCSRVDEVTRVKEGLAKLFRRPIQRQPDDYLFVRASATEA